MNNVQDGTGNQENLGSLEDKAKLRDFYTLLHMNYMVM